MSVIVRLRFVPEICLRLPLRATAGVRARRQTRTLVRLFSATIPAAGNLARRTRIARPALIALRQSARTRRARDRLAEALVSALPETVSMTAAALQARAGPALAAARAALVRLWSIRCGKTTAPRTRFVWEPISAQTSARSLILCWTNG